MQVEIITVRLGELHLGVRTNEPALTDRLRRLLAPHLIEHGQAPGNLSLALGSADGPARALHLLYRSAAREVRTTSLGRLVRAVLVQLEGYGPPPSGAVRLNARPLIGPEGAVLVDRRLDQQLEQVERRLARKGFRRADHPYATIDTSTGKLSLATRLAFEPEAAAAFELEHPLEDGEVATTEDLVPVSRLVAITSTAPPGLQFTPAQAVMTLAPIVADRDRRVHQDGLRVLAPWVLDGRADLRVHLTERQLLSAVVGET